MQSMLDGPAGEAPVGVVDHSNLSIALWAIGSACIAISSVAVAVRMFTKLSIMKNAGAEDWLATIGWAFHASFCVTAIIGTVHGSGHHIWDLQLKDIEPILYVGVPTAPNTKEPKPK